MQQRMKAGLAWHGWGSAEEQNTWFVFTTEFGDHYCPQTVYDHFKRIARQIGAEKANVHSLRHTYAVLCLQNGDDVKTVQSNLGHATAAFTLDVYGHVSEKNEAGQRKPHGSLYAGHCLWKDPKRLKGQIKGQTREKRSETL